MQKIEPVLNNPGQGQNRWYSARRDYFTRNLFRGFHQAMKGFLAIYQRYLHSNHISYQDLDRLVGSENNKGSLWLLKDHCHQLWQQSESLPEINGYLLDWLIGSIFHEAMKLKENIYLNKYYGPLAQKNMQQGVNNASIHCGLDCQYLMNRILKEAANQLEDIGMMFGRANYILRITLPSLKNNNLLLRYLVEHEEMTRELWAEPLTDIFAEIFTGKGDEGYCQAARSYQEGQWWQEAADAYRKALELNPANQEARNFKLNKKQEGGTP